MGAFEEAFQDYLSTDTDVVTAVGERVTINRIPEGVELPAISWRRVTANRVNFFDPFEDYSAWTTVRVQVDCWGTTAAEAIGAGEAVLAALSGYGGDMAGTYVGSSFALNEFDDFEQRTAMHRRTLEFVLTYEDEPTAS